FEVLSHAARRIIREKSVADAQFSEEFEKRSRRGEQSFSTINRAVHVEGNMANELEAFALGVFRFQTTSMGQAGRASRKAFPYCFAKMRLSRTTMMPVSVFVRMRRPTPWRNLRMASGRENSLKESPPRASIASMRASIKGWSGTANGSRVIITLESAS